MMEEVVVSSAGGDQASAQDDMVQYVIYSGEGDQPIGLEELRDALTKLTGQTVNLQGNGNKGDEDLNDSTQALSADTDLNFRLSAERMVGEVSFVDDNIVENGQNVGQEGQDTMSEKLVIDDSAAVNALLKQQEKPQMPTQITIETEYGPITLDTNKLTPGQLDGTEQITVNLLTTDASGDAAKAVRETRGLKLPPGLLGPKHQKAIYDADENSIQGSDFNSVLQQLTDLCSEQNPLPVKDSDALDDFMNLKLPHEQQKQPGVIEVDKLESFLRNKFGDSAKIQIHPTGVVVQQPPKSCVKPVICCAAHSELKNQETRRYMLPIPLDVSKCPECNKECVNRKNLRLHIQRFHVPDFKHQCQTRARVVPPPPEDIITDIPILVETADNLREIGEKSAPKAYKCSVCDAQFSTQKEYFAHIDTHGACIFSCSVCGSIYSNAGSLKRHVRIVHGGSEMYQCKYCMLKFEEFSSWKEHETQHETANENTVQCLKCDTLVETNKFRQHMATLHRIISKPKLDCVYCGTRFRSTEFMVKHTHQFHNFEKNPHLCNLCYKAFPTAHERDSHTMRAHSDGEMMEGEVEFSWQPRDCFKRQCARCGNIFNSYAKLKVHYDKLHNDSNCCLLCGREFHWIVNLDLHYKKEHSIMDLVKFGIVTPTMNLVRFGDSDFELVPKIGRQYCSRMDVMDQESGCDETLDNNKMTVVEYMTLEPASGLATGSGSSRVYNKNKEPKIVVRHPKAKTTATPPKVAFKGAPTIKLPSSMAAAPKPRVEFTEDEYNKVMGKTEFDYTKLLPPLAPGADITGVKAPRHNDIVIGRPATVINLARVWSRRERGLFYMGNEADKFRRAAATIPKKRVGEKWVEMPLFVDELGGKLVTVEGMAELWRERAQMFLDYLGKGQKIDDFLPLYELGQNMKGGKPLAKEVASNVKRNETSIKFVEDETDSPESVEKITLVSATKSGRTLKITEKAKGLAKDKDSDAENLEEGEIPRSGEIDETMFTRRIMLRHSDGSLSEKEKKSAKEKKEAKEPKEPKEASRKRSKKEPEKDIIPDIVSGIKKAKRDMKARAGTPKGATTVKKTREKPRGGLVKGRKGCPPGFNPDRFCPFPRRPRLVLTDIREIIGDARKIIVQMEADHSPERKFWKKQTARKGFATRRPTPAHSGSGDQARTRQSRFEKKDKTDEEEQRRTSTRAQKEKPLDEVDGPRKTRTQEKRQDEEQQDKGDAPSKGARSAATKAGEKRSAKNDSSSPPSKKAKTPSLVSPREATLTGKTKPETDVKTKTPMKKVEVETKAKSAKKKEIEEEKPKRSVKKLKEIEEEKTKSPKKAAEETKTNPSKEPEKRGRGRPKKQQPPKEVDIDITPKETEENTPVLTEMDIAESEESQEDPEMPTLEIEISHHEYMIPADSPLPSTSSTSDDISRETKRAMEFLPADFDLEEASLNTSRKTIKMHLHEDEAASVKIVGSALSPAKERQEAVEDRWDVLIGTPTKTIPHAEESS